MEPYRNKSSVEEIRERFEHDVERFSDLHTGQVSTIDAPLAMELITRAAAVATHPVRRILDIGCGAGNNTLKLLELAPGAECTLVDLAGAMVERAVERVKRAGAGKVTGIQGDFRETALPERGFDVILAAAVLHHLRGDEDWERAFQKLYALTAPGGSVWITDLISHEIPAVERMMFDRYCGYLESVGGAEYRGKVAASIAKEDSPRPVTNQLELLRRSGFSRVELLHKNSSFAAFGAWKSI